MSNCLEVLFVSDNNNNNGKTQTVNCFNPHIGTTLMTYRGCGASAKNCVSLVGKDYLLSAEEGKPILHVWALNSQEPASDLKTITPGKLSALGITPDGNYCLGGIDGKIYVWQISSGYLLNVITKHYQTINKIVCTNDSSHFITAGEDGLVLVWKLAEAVFKECGSIFNIPKTQTSPLYTFCQHSLPVTDIHVGHGGLKARLFTVSVDQTCKIFCLTSGTLLLSLMFDHVLTSVTVNDLETVLFVGTNSGNIHALDIDHYPRTLEHTVSEDSNTLSTFAGHTQTVTCLMTSFDGATLASGGNDAKVLLWSISGKQLLRSFDMKGPISNLFFSIVSDNIFSNKFNPSIVMKKFEKVNNPDEKDLELNVWVHENLKPISFEASFEDEEKQEDSFELSEEKEEENIDKLKQHIVKLKDVNKQLYQFAMNRILKNPLDHCKD